MPNWRKPLLDFYETRLRRYPSYYVPLLEGDHARPIEERRRIQLERLSQLLLHAERHVPYYQGVLRDSGVVVEGKVDLGRFHLVPQSRRETLRANFERLKSDDLASPNWYKNSSGGSTGEPVVLI